MTAGVMDDDSESTELMEEVPQLDYASQNWRDWCVVDREKPRVDSTDDGKYTGKKRSVIRRDDEQASVTKDEERVL